MRRAVTISVPLGAPSLFSLGGGAFPFNIFAGSESLDTTRPIQRGNKNQSMKKKKSVSKKSDKDKLAAGAAKIQKAQKELKNGKGKKAKVAAAPPEPVVIPESTRPIQDILKDHVTVLPGSIGLKISDNIPIEESLRVLDWTTTLSNHVGFMIGDVLNYSESKWGEKYTAALNQTGRAHSTLAHYASVARRLASDKRIAALTFAHHREILTLGDSAKIETVLKEVGAQAEKGEAPTVKELRHKVQNLTPRKAKKPKKATSGKGKKKVKELPPYEPDADEQSKLDAAEDAATTLGDAIKAGGVFKIAAKLDNKEKKRWVAMFQPFVTFHDNLDRITGYSNS